MHSSYTGVASLTLNVNSVLSKRVKVKKSNDLYSVESTK